MKASVNQEECISCGACIDLCPEVFQWDEENDEKAVASTNPVPEDVQESCREAAESCPTDAITLEE
ncbi:4Fe-4S dicluster domain-containing protein [candidate division KSB3 bacterium]|jgi:ferredoxin|uniref:Ferredoxin n=1 Tax=candidate division KSB3 bacterium TaxID=2044937 RepID=A0A9D5Q4W9_9BACT|nr:4Fe-4S dicluster domain-containing protein [candidate division KSB3 bacterium]MBD3323985.1 4Fe-4S dicluster domain-containing protein [candidate division KSB3 bacterium]